MPAGATRPIESSRGAASAAIRSIIRTLETSIELRGERIIWVRMEDAEASDVRESFMESSISRELQVLSSHTVHHFALIAITLRMHGVEMDPDFGMAPSTLRYLASKTAGGCVMCTVSWVHRPGGYHLLCNRDEKRTRGSGPCPATSGARRRTVHRAGRSGTSAVPGSLPTSLASALCLLNGTADTRPHRGV